MSKIKEIIDNENKLFAKWGGNIPEANNDLNDLQREKITAIYEQYGKAYIGKINYFGETRENLTAQNVFTEYNGGMVYNFEADFIIPLIDNGIAEMIIKWNKETSSITLLDRITERIEKIGGVNFIWS